MKTTVTGVAAAVMGILNNFTVGLFNVPGTVVLLAISGALLSYAYDIPGEEQPTKRDGKFYFKLAANALTATAAISVVPSWFGWQWYNTKMEGSMAFLFALSARFAVPFFFKMLPELFRKWFRIGEYKQVQQQPMVIQEETNETDKPS